MRQQLKGALALVAAMCVLTTAGVQADLDTYSEFARKQTHKGGLSSMQNASVWSLAEF
jgi:hypothetical protein